MLLTWLQALSINLWPFYGALRDTQLRTSCWRRTLVFCCAHNGLSSGFFILTENADPQVLLSMSRMKNILTLRIYKQIVLPIYTQSNYSNCHATELWKSCCLLCCQKHTVELCSSSSVKRLHTGHVRSTGSCSCRGAEWSWCLLVLRWVDAENDIFQLTNWHWHGQSTGQDLSLSLMCWIFYWTWKVFSLIAFNDCQLW